MFFIDKLWEGKITPAQKAVRAESEYHKILHKLSREVSSFTSGLDENQKKEYERIDVEQTELNGIECKELFIEGFRLGAGMILDVLDEYKGQLCIFNEE